MWNALVGSYTGVWFLVHDLLSHVTANACRCSFGPPTFAPKFDDHPIYSLRICSFGPVRTVVSARRIWMWTKTAYSKRLNRMIIKFRREGRWTKTASARICRHVREEVVDQKSYPRVLWLRDAYGATCMKWLRCDFGIVIRVPFLEDGFLSFQGMIHCLGLNAQNPANAWSGNTWYHPYKQ